MIQQLFKVLEEQRELSGRDKRTLTENVSIKFYKDREHFVKEGEVSKKAGFVLSGVFRYYFGQEKQEETTSLFVQEDQFIVKMESFYNGQPSSRSIQAIGECEVLEMTKKGFDNVVKKMPEFQMIMGKAATKFLEEMSSFQRRIIDMEAEVKYKEFLKEYPSLENKVSLGQVASYIGITQSTLSRIRKRILK